MIRSILLFLFLLALISSSSADEIADGAAKGVAGGVAKGIAGGIAEGASRGEHPHGAVILVVDGLGASYVYPEHSAYALDGSPLGKAVLFNLTGGGARAIDVRVPVPETGKSHSVLVTGSTQADPDFLGPTIFDAARESGYLCLAVLERGDSLEMLKKQDAVLYLDDNSIHGAEPVPGFRGNVSEDLRSLLQAWRDRFAWYTSVYGTVGYSEYNRWGIDAASDLVAHLRGKPFFLLVNVGATDSAGHELGPEEYLKVAQALDAPIGNLTETCRRSGVLLVVTADHGMAFPGKKGRGGHASPKYAEQLEALRVPLVFFGPGVDELNLGARWSQVDIAPTVMSLLGISRNASWEGKSMPIKESYSLRVVGAPGEVALYRGEELVARSSGQEHDFEGLPRGQYTVKAGGKSLDVLINGDQLVDLAERGSTQIQADTKKILGIILILAINLAGTLVIIRIIRKDKK
jgi:2,3-bisphosphoglycerate-independent phosphoglycerate mutase